MQTLTDWNIFKQKNPKFLSLDRSTQDKVRAQWLTGKLSESNKFNSLDDSTKQSVISRMDEELRTADTYEKAPEKRGFISDAMSHFLRGTAEAAGSIGSALEMADLTPYEADEDRSFLDRTGKTLSDWAAEKAESPSTIPSREEQRGEYGFIKRGVMGGIESLPQSAAPFIAGVAGTLVGGPVAGAIAGTGTLMATFGLGQYGQEYSSVMDELKRTRPELSKEERQEIAHKAAFGNAAFEVGTETLSDIAALVTFGGSKALVAPINATLKNLTRSSAKELFKKSLQVAATETGSEMVAGGGQAWVRQNQGLIGQTIGEGIAESVIPALTMSLFFGVGGATLNRAQSNAVLGMLNSENKNKRIEAANYMSQRIADGTGDPELADAWLSGAKEVINNGSKFEINEKIADFAKTKALEAQQKKDISRAESIPEAVEAFNEAVKPVAEAPTISKLDNGFPVQETTAIQENLPPVASQPPDRSVEPDMSFDQRNQGPVASQPTTTPMTVGRLNKEVSKYKGTGGIATEAKESGFKPAFRDAETGEIYESKYKDGSPSALHNLDGLPDDVVLKRDFEGYVEEAKPSLESGFLKGGKFYTREEAVKTQQEDQNAQEMQRQEEEIAPPAGLAPEPTTEGASAAALPAVPQLKSTGEAIDFGRTATPEQVADLDNMYQANLNEVTRLRSEGNIEDAGMLAQQNQFYREASEVAKGTPLGQKLLARRTERKPQATPGTNVQTLRGRIKAMGGINPLNFKGEKRSMPVSAQFMFKNNGVPLDVAEQTLKDEGWLDQGEDLLELLRTNQDAPKRGKVISTEAGTKYQQEQANQIQAISEREPEEPPKGNYVEVKAIELPKGGKFTIIDGSGLDGWDEYEVIDKDEFGITLKDGRTIEVPPDEVLQVKQEIDPTRAKQATMLDVEPELFDRANELGKPARNERKEKVVQREQNTLFGPNQASMFTGNGDVKYATAKSKIETVELKQDGIDFKTGLPVTFDFVHNTESATKMFGKPKKDSPYDRGYEPSGRYVTQVGDKSKAYTNDKIISGTLSLNNPLVINGDGWKRKLSAAYGGLTGKKLSRAIIADGYDGVVTTGENSQGKYVSEILDLTTFDEGKAKYATAKQQDKKNLLIVHNLSTENLNHAIKLGGLPVPSTAVIDVDKSDFTGFGEITLIANHEKLGPVSPEQKYFDADVYSPRYPRAKSFLTPKSEKAIANYLEPIYQEIPKTDNRFIDPPYTITEDVKDRGVSDTIVNGDQPLFQYAYLKEIGKLPKGIDTSWKGKDKLRKAIEENGREKYAEWAENKISELGIEADNKIFKGFTYSGRPRYSPETLDEITKMLKKELKDGEGFNYGVPSIRAKLAKRYRSIAQMQKDRGRIISSEEMDAIKEQTSSEFDKLAEQAIDHLKYKRGFGDYDTFSEHVKEAIDTRNLNRVFGEKSEYYNSGVDIKAIGDFLNKLSLLPTEYFEGKLQRPVGINEFETAVVPSDTPEKTISQLLSRGLRVEKYDKKIKGDRARVIRDLADEPKSRTPRFSTSRGLPNLDAVTLKDIQSLPKVKNAGQSEDGTIWAQMDNGKMINIHNVAEISPDKLAFETSYGRAVKTGESIAGSIKKTDAKTYEMQLSNLADKFTAVHEVIHFAESEGLIPQMDINAVGRAVQKKGQENTEENRAKFIEDTMRDRNMLKQYGTFTRRAIQRIIDIVDTVANIFRRTALGVVRDLESNKKSGYSPAQNERGAVGTTPKKTLFKNYGAKILGDNVVLYRGGNVSESTLKKLRYGDYLSAVETGFDSTGNEGARAYGKNVVRFELPLSDVEVTGAGEFQYKGNSKSLSGGNKYPTSIYRAYNDYYGSNYTAKEIDAQDNVGSIASMSLSGGREEFDSLMEKHTNPDVRYSTRPQSELEQEVTGMFGAEKLSVKDRFNAVVDLFKTEEGRTQLVTRTLDKLKPIQTAVSEKAYRLHRILPSSRDLLGTLIVHGKIKVDDDLNPYVDTRNEGLKALLDKAGKDWKKLPYWVAAKRAEQIDAEDDAAGLTGDKRREKYLTPDKRARIFEYAGASDDARMNELAKELMEFNASVLDFAYKMGLISKDFRDSDVLNKEYYIPFYRVFEDAEIRGKYESLVKGPHRGNKYISSQIKKLTGSETKPGDPLENLLKNWSHMFNEGMRNRARAEVGRSQTAIDSGVIEIVPPNAVKSYYSAPLKRHVYVRTDPNGKETLYQKDEKLTFVKDKDETNILMYQDNGKPTYIQVNDPDLYNAMTNMNMAQFDNLIFKMLRGTKKWLTYGATFGPAFRVANLMRDTMQTALLNKNFKPFIDSFRGFISSIKEDQTYLDYLAAGGASGASYVNADNPEAAHDFIKRIMKKEGKDAKNWILDTPKKMLDFWDRIGAASEYATKVQYYKNLIDSGKTKLDAAFEARDVLDFSMSGQANIVQAIIQTVPFVNARFQGLYKLYKSASDKDNRKNFVTRGAILTAATLGLWMLNKDDDRWKELEDYDKWSYYHFWIGDTHIRIPKPFEVGAGFSSFPEVMADTLYSNADTKHIADFIGYTGFQTFSIGVPQLFQPLIEQWANKSAFTGRPIVGMGLEGLKAGEQAEPWTSETLRALGKQLNISPKRAEALVQSYFSTLGMFVLGASDIAIRNTLDFPEQPAQRIDDYPLVGRFVKRGEPRSTKYQTWFYDTFDEMDTLNKTFNYYNKTGEFLSAKKIKEENKKSFRLKKEYNKIRNDMSKINQDMKRIYRSRTLTDDAKKDQLDKLYEKKNRLTKQAYEKYYKGE